MDEPAGDHRYAAINFYRDTVEFFARALAFYEELIDEELSDISEDEHLNALLTDEVKRDHRLDKDARQVEQMRQFLDQELSKGDGRRFHCDLSLSHWAVRYLKSVGSLYLNHLRNRRNRMATSAQHL